jgi:hypothetical protein
MARRCDNQSAGAAQNVAKPTGFPAAWKKLLAKPYQTAIGSAVQTMADRKNSLGRGKNETNMSAIHDQVREFARSLIETEHAGATVGGINQIITSQSRKPHRLRI